MVQRCEWLRRMLAAPGIALALLLCAALSGGPAAAHPAGRGSAHSCGGNPPTTAPTTASGGPTIALGHASGPPGMSESITGAGWPAGAHVTAELDVRQSDSSYQLGQQSLATATTSPDGSFSMAGFAIPYPPGCSATSGQGIQTVFIVRTQDNKIAATTAFTFTPQPTLEPRDSLHPRTGQPFTVDGTGWEPGEAMTIVYSLGAPVEYQNGITSTSSAPPQPLPGGTITPHADAHGDVTASYTLPATLTPRSTLIIQATGTGPKYGTVVQLVPIQLLVFPDVPPTLTLDRASGTVSDSITVRGTSWYPFDTVNVTYCRGSFQTPNPSGLGCRPELSASLADVPVDAHGAFTTTVHLPSNAKTGPITIQALSANDNPSNPIYVQGALYSIVPPPLPWNKVHPHLAFVVSILMPALPALAIGLVLAAIYLWRRRSRHAHAASGAGKRTRLAT